MNQSIFLNSGFTQVIVIAGGDDDGGTVSSAFYLANNESEIDSEIHSISMFQKLLATTPGRKPLSPITKSAPIFPVE